MAKEGSVAPKERINVTFKPATGGAQEEIELPLRMPNHPISKNKWRKLARYSMGIGSAEKKSKRIIIKFLQKIFLHT